MITSPIAGTTIDAVDSLVTIDGQEFILIDTAGIRRKSKTEQGVEVLSVVQARKALERCDVAVLLVDGEEGITDQDEKIGGLIEDVGCGLIIAINKWDTVEGRTKGLNKEYASDLVREKMAYLRYAPLLIMSALKRQGLKGMGELVDEILKQRQVRVNTREFTEWVREESEIHNPMNARFYMCHQAGRNPPTFVCHVNHPDKIDFSLKRHLIKAIREKWGYMGNPVRLHFVEGKGRAAKRPPAAR
jgi:GTP-binding protein